METITPKIGRGEIVCAEQPAGPTAMIVFGASGDLTQRMLLPSLFDVYRRKLVSEKFYILGSGRTHISDEQFRRLAEEAIGKKDQDTAVMVQSFTQRCHFICGDYGDTDFYEELKKRIGELNRLHGVDGSTIFYLSIPPLLYPEVVEHLGRVGLTCPEALVDRKKVRLIIEKPFGHDLESAHRLNEIISRCFDESQIYRIDHYLGKETVQNILMFRFANAIFEPIWNRNYIDHIQITIAESVGIEHRAGYYDKSGALRDMFQNHMLQMLALVAMEPPTSFDADRIRDEKVKLLRSIRPIEFKPWSAQIVRGRYAAGKINGRDVRGYLQEQGIPEDSKTETFVALKLFVDNWRWRAVPFYVRTGKRLAAKSTEIAITFRQVPHSMFISAGIEELSPNVLILQIQPQEGMSLQFQAKQPGSKICMGTLDMRFHYADVFAVELPQAYARLLLDAMLGDQTLFNRYDSVEIAWKLFDPVLRQWQDSDASLYDYPAGAQSFPAADDLIESDGRRWRTIENE